MTPEAKRIAHYCQLLETELTECQRRQQALIAALHRARAELQALDGRLLYLDGELLIRE